ncbi:MAG: hypothetical protein ABIQ52_17170 [Vicinamibacterales bacterium]
MTELYRRLRYLLNRRRSEQELADEMAFHRAMASRDGGRPFGNTLRLREEARDAWGWTWIDRLSQDLRYAVRMLRRSPGFTAVAILMLAVGIGVNVAVFGFLNAVVFSPLPVRDPETLLRFERRSPLGFASELPYPEVAFMRDDGQEPLCRARIHRRKRPDRRRRNTAAGTLRHHEFLHGAGRRPQTRTSPGSGSR